MRWIWLAAALASASLCAGCAGPVSRLPGASATAIATEQYRQQLAQARDYYRQRNRVDNVAFRILTANTRFCGERVTAQIGLIAGTVRSLPRRYRIVAAQALNLSWSTPRVIAVAEGSPAALAGIAPGDDVLTLNGQPVPRTGTTRWISDNVAAAGAAPVSLTTRRSGETRQLTLYPIAGCSIPVELRTHPTANAFTDDNRIVIHSGFLRMTPTDADLAVIIGHELAHANLGHLPKRERNAILGQVGGALIDGGLLLGGIYTGGTFARHFKKAGALTYSVDFEREADYVGAYYAARAGYDIAGTENLWRAMALESPSAIRLATTHPTTPERYLFMRKTVAEIAGKTSHHLPLVPELKLSVVQAAPAYDGTGY